MKILYAMSAMYPYGTPYAARVMNFCRLLKLAGHEVIVFCDYYSDVKKNTSNIEYFEGTKVYYTATERNVISKATVMYRTPKKIKQFLSDNDIDVVITSSASNRFGRILRICKNIGIPLILEINEKYHFTNWEFGRFDIRYYQFKHCWNTEYPQADGFITISSLLTEYFEKYSKPIIQIPTIMDVQESQSLVDFFNYNEDEIHFNFSGGLGGGKDRLGEFIVALQNVNPKRRMLIDIFGPSRKSVVEQVDSQNNSCFDEKQAIIHGRIPQKDVPLQIAKCDYGLILRPNRESSNAGFPTKIAEYMSVGTPVIANPTSDIANYVVDGVNGFLVENLSSKCLCRVLKKTDEIQMNDYLKMRCEARKTALEYFDYRQYTDRINELVHLVLNNKE